MEPTVEKFLSVARRFEEWAARGTDQGLDAAQEGLRLIAQLYSAGLELPEAEDFDSEEVPEIEEVRVSDAEWRQVFKHSARLPFGYYSEISNPLLVLAGEHLVLGDIGDDIADIFRDVVEGIRLFDRGLENEALEQWSSNLRFHWGDHATSAMRALNWCVAHGVPDLDEEASISPAPPDTRPR